MNKIRLQTPGYKTKLIVINTQWFDDDTKTEIVEGLDDENEDNLANITLRDVAIVMESMVPSGVMKQLAVELSNEIPDISPQTAINSLTKIFRKYYKMSEEEADKKWEELENYKDLEDE